MDTSVGAMDPFARQQAAMKRTTAMTLDMWRLWSEAATRGSNGGSRPVAAAVDENLGAVVWNRVVRSSRVYMRFAEFWIEFLRDVPGLRDHRNPGSVFGRWAKLYSGLFEQVVGSPPRPEPATSRPWANLLGPWADAMTAWSSVWPGLTTAPAPGRRGSGASGLWGDVLNETLGKLLPGAPERWGGANSERTRDAYLGLNRSLAPLYRLFYSAGVEALNDFLTQVGEAGIEALAARPLREVYRMWWTANENAFVRMFALPDFGIAMNDVLTRSLDLKQRTDDMAADRCRQAALPTRADFDELAAAVQELRRTVRRQEHEIESLNAQLAAGRRRGRAS